MADNVVQNDHPDCCGLPKVDHHLKILLENVPVLWLDRLSKADVAWE